MVNLIISSLRNREESKCYDRHPVRPARATWLGGRGRPGGPRAR
jgi:hypothetical protein